MTAFVKVHGIELAYDEYGEGFPFVLVHGWTGSGRDWVDVAGEISRERRVIALHQRGHGESSKPGDASTYTFDQLVDDLEGFVDELGLEQFDLLGHSMGGLVAMRYAVRHPSRVRSLIPMDTGADPTPGADQWMQPLIDIVEAGGMTAYFAAAKDFVFPGGEDVEGIAALQWTLEHVDPVAFVRFANQLTTYAPFLDDLRSLPMPATVIVGENDVTLLGAADALVEAIPRAVLEVVPNAAHVPNKENPEGWLAAIAHHFARING